MVQSIEKLRRKSSFSLIERVILSAGAMLIFSVSFQIDHYEFVSLDVDCKVLGKYLQCPKAKRNATF